MIISVVTGPSGLDISAGKEYVRNISVEDITGDIVRAPQNLKHYPKAMLEEKFPKTFELENEIRALKSFKGVSFFFRHIAFVAPCLAIAYR